jgi:hypothetical protein
VDDVLERSAMEAPEKRRLLTVQRLSRIALGLVVFLDLVIPAAFAYRVSLVFPTFHMDGAFQTASGLLRLHEGEFPGRDFFPYLGVGPLLLLYPAFLLRGADVTGSVFAAHLVSLMALQLVFALLAALVLGCRSPWVLALSAGMPLLLSVAVGEWSGAFGGVDELCGGCVDLSQVASLPGNSLRPVRALAPYLLAAIAYFVLTRRGRLIPKLAVIGTASGVVAAVWSNDYGLVSGGLMVATTTAYVVLSGPGRRVRATAVLWGAAAAGFLVAGFGATAGYFLPYLSYNLVDVRGDQFWYYGGWGESDKVYSVGDLLGIMYREAAVFPLVVLAGVVVWAVRRRQLRWVFACYVGTALLLGGLAGTIGGHAGEYFWAFRVWGYAMVLMALIALAREGLARALSRGTTAWSAQDRHRLSERVRRGLAAATVGVLVLAAALTVTRAWDLRRDLATDPYVTYDAALGGYLDVRFEEHVQLTTKPGTDVLEEYMGLAGSVLGPRDDLQVDSVIHALGSQRPAFAARAAQPHDMVVTSTPEMNQFVSWSISANWWFYRTLFQSYRPTQTSPSTIVWTPADPAPWAPVECRVTDSGVQLQTATPGFYEVTVRYRGPGRNARAYTLLQNNINIAVGADGYVALDPGAESQQVPVYVREAPRSGTTSLAVKDVRGGDDADPLTDFLGCSGRAVSVPDGAETVYLYSGLALTDATWPYQPTPVRLTDDTWTSGVNNADAAFFVPDSQQNLDALQDATRVRFSDGEVRRITSVVRTSPYINVYLDGPPLDPETAGYPNVFELLP